MDLRNRKLGVKGILGAARRSGWPYEGTGELEGNRHRVPRLFDLRMFMGCAAGLAKFQDTTRPEGYWR